MMQASFQVKERIQMREYTERIRVWITKEDYDKVKERMKEAGIKNMSSYIRKMALNGYMIRLDLSDLKEVLRLMRITANNMNQYAKRANENGSIYLADIRDIQRREEEIWQLLKAILERLSDL